MAITHVVGQSGRGTWSSGSSMSATMAETPIQGNILVACVGINCGTGDGDSVTSIAQNNVTWTLQIAENTTRPAEIWFGVVGASAGTGITVNMSDTPDWGAIFNVYEYSGVATSSFLDKTASWSDGFNIVTLTGTTAETTQADELWIGCTLNGGHTTQNTPLNGFTLYDGVYDGKTLTVGFLEKIVSSTGTANSGVTSEWSVNSGCIATFKAAAAASGQQLFTLINMEDY